jgi:hypothetical protein
MISPRKNLKTGNLEIATSTSMLGVDVGDALASGGGGGGGEYRVLPAGPQIDSQLQQTLPHFTTQKIHLGRWP